LSVLVFVYAKNPSDAFSRKFPADANYLDIVKMSPTSPQQIRNKSVVVSL